MIKKIFVFLIIFIISIEIFTYVSYKLYPALIPEYPQDVEGIKNGEFLFKPHHYYAVELNPEYTKIRVNRYGLRGADFSVEKKEKEIRIACIGGSTVQSMCIEDTMTYPVLLEKNLKKINNSVRVINCGVGTYTSAENLIAYHFKVSEFNPDILIITMGLNDVLATAFYEKYSSDYREYRKIWEEKKHRIPEIFFKFADYSYFFKMIVSRTGYDIWDVSLNHFTISRKEGLKNINKPDFGKYYRKNLETLIISAINNHSKIILTTFPINRNAYFEWKSGLQKINDITKELAAKYKLYCIDIAAIEIHDELNSRIFMDYCHYTVYGNEWRSRIIADYIIKNEIVKNEK